MKHKKYGQEDLKKQRFIAFGITSISEADFEPKGCSSGMKPDGGLCAYQYFPERKSGKFISPYERWCEEEEAGLGDLRNGTAFRIRHDADVVFINTWGDLYELIRKFPYLKTVKIGNTEKAVDAGIDYTAFAAVHDALYITNIGMVQTDIDEKREIDLKINRILRGKYAAVEAPQTICLNTSGFEVPCICIFNPNIITGAEYIENPNIHQLDRNEAFDEAAKELARGKTDDDIVCILSKYFQKEGIQDLVQEVRKIKKDEKRFRSLIDYIMDLMKINGKNGIILDDDIYAAVENALKIISDKKDVDKSLHEQFCSQLESVIKTMEIADRRSVQNAKSSVDIMAEAFEGL